MYWLILGALLPSLIVCWAAGFAVRRWGPHLGLVDRPGHRKIHSTPMPTSGGLAIWLGIVLPLAVGQAALWAVNGQSAVDSRQQSAVGSRQSAVDSRQSTVGSRQSVVGSRQAALGSRQSAVAVSLPAMIAPHVPGLLHQSGKLWTLLAGGTVLMLLGLADDRRGLDWRLRLGVQTAVAIAIVSLSDHWRMSLFVDMPWLTG
ncbi:MAG: hypothetical protein ABFC96_18245, partial [Thermoguttaceae bacterium]